MLLTELIFYFFILKFTIAVVVLVLAVSAQSSLVPLTWSGINGLEKSITYSSPLTSIGLTARLAPITPYSSFAPVAPIAYTSHATRLAYVPSYTPTVRITPQAPLVVQSVVPVPTEG